MREVDFSQYQPDEMDKYLAVRSNSKHVQLNYFHNEVQFSHDGRSLEILVDPAKEPAFLYPDADWDEGHLREQNAEDEEEASADSEDALASLEKRFTIHKDNWEYFYDTETPYLINKLCGTVVELPVGEGILDFCYADFIQGKSDLEFLRLMLGDNKVNDAFRKILRGEHPPKREAPTPEQIRDNDDWTKYESGLYESVFSLASHFFYRSLYTAIFPPLFTRLTDADLDFYLNYLVVLQKEFLELIEFCFDESFFPQILGHLAPSERYYLYCHIRKHPVGKKRQEQFSMSPFRSSGTQMPYGMSTEQKISRLQSHVLESPELDAFLARYGVERSVVAGHLVAPAFVSVDYTCASIYDMLYLEFTKMLERNVRFKKCGRCGRYFILKGNYNTEYCDRIPDGETRSCQTLAALANYKAKVETNPAWSAYRKYYKRYFERMKVGTIKEPAFKKWQYEAVYKRDTCASGEITIDEYLAWLDAAFPNRKKSQSAISSPVPVR